MLRQLSKNDNLKSILNDLDLVVNLDYFHNENLDSKYFVNEVEDKIKALVLVKSTSFSLHKYYFKAAIIEILYYENNKSLYDLLDQVMLSIDDLYLFTFINNDNQQVIKKYNFTLYDKLKVYNIKRSDIVVNKTYQSSLKYDIKKLYTLYKDFNEHFDSFILKSLKQFKSDLKYLVDYKYEVLTVRNDKELMGYAIYKYKSDEIVISEIVYLDSLSFKTMVNQIMGLYPKVKVASANSERIDLLVSSDYKVFDNLYIRVNDKYLYESLFDLKNLDLSDSDLINSQYRKYNLK